jgi:hypothetical protein
MGFVERIFHPVISAVERAFTPPGTGGQEAAAQQVQAAQTAKLPAAPIPPAAPAAPAAPPQFQPGARPGASQSAQTFAKTVLGAAAAGGEVAKASAGAGQKKSVLG